MLLLRPILFFKVFFPVTKLNIIVAIVISALLPYLYWWKPLYPHLKLKVLRFTKNPLQKTYNAFFKFFYWVKLIKSTLEYWKEISMFNFHLLIARWTRVALSRVKVISSRTVHTTVHCTVTDCCYWTYIWLEKKHKHIN